MLTFHKGVQPLVKLVLFVHVLSAMGIFAALGIEWQLLDRPFGAGPSEVQRVLRSVGALSRVGGISSALLLASGLYLTTVKHLWEAGWPLAATLSLVLIGALGAGRLHRLSRRLKGDALLSVLRRPALRSTVTARAWVGVGAVFLMTVKPSLVPSLLVLALTLFLPLVVRSHRAAST